MKAAAWHGKHDIRVDDVPDPSIRERLDAIVCVTSSGACKVVFIP
jgi:threonine dehydrogenase-like Zn-dependent dehydrogenase